MTDTALNTLSTHEAQKFLNHEARLLDQRRFADWLSLYTKDAIYWVPRAREQTDAINVPSIIYDDQPLMAMRVKRLLHPRVYSALPTPYTLHVIGGVDIVGSDEARKEYSVVSSQLIIESRDIHKRLFAASCRHVLRLGSDGPKIASKRLDLVDCDSIKDVMVVPL